jgi:hypothetical protein
VLYVILPSLIAGFFGITPLIYNELTKPRAEMSYNVVSGPSIPVTNQFRRIFAIRVTNTGKIPLNHTTVEISSPNGQIESLVAEQPPDTMTVERMLPGEQVNTSVMPVSNSSEPFLRVQARSDEVVGIEQAPEQNSTEPTQLVAFGALASGLAVAAMTLLAATRLRKLGRRVDILGNILEGGEKGDVITFIAGVSQVIPVSEQMWLSAHDITYARLADLFLFIGLKGDDSVKSRCILGLQALLVIGGIADTSLKKMRENLELLGIKYDDQQFADLRRAAVKNLVDARKKVIAVFRSGTLESRDVRFGQ